MDHSGSLYMIFVWILAWLWALMFSGCQQSAGVEQSQAKPQTVVASNTQQIAALAALIGRNQRKLQIDAGHVPHTAGPAVVGIACARDEQAMLYQFLRNHDQQMSASLVGLAQNQQTMMMAVGLPIAPQPTGGE